MIRIAVVDDEKQERETLRGYFKELQAEMREELSVYLFESGEAFLKEEEISFDLVCLDIDMEGRDGISVAREIRKKDGEILIVFVTNMAQMAIRGYEVQALDFMLKPIGYFSFAMRMRGAIQMLHNRKSRSIVINTGGGIRKISTDDLMYVEVNGHDLYYHTVKDTFRQKAALREIEDKLAGLPFKRCNNCYLVNLKYVDGVERDDLKVGGEWLKISRPRKKEFLQSLADYMGGISL